MKYAVKPVVVALQLAMLSLSSQMPNAYAETNAPTIAIDKIIVTHQRHQSLDDNLGLAIGKTSTPDLANWLTSLPGANINNNGPVSGIAQYRGLYGDRLAISLDGHPVIGAGPNAMDTPLSYSTPLIVDSMTIYRGVAPVASSIDTLGGVIDVNMRKAEISDSANWQTNGDLQVGYRSNSDTSTLSTVANASKEHLAVMLYANIQSGDDYESGSGILVSPTKFEKRQFGGDIRFASNEHETGVSYHYTDTQNSGTPALPMDIEYIFSHRVGADGELYLGKWLAKWLIGYTDADHGMTNFLMRENNDMTKYRRNNATAQTTDFKLSIKKLLGIGEVELGIDGYLAKHDSIITNPHNVMFEVVNFNDVKDDRIGFYIQWQKSIGETQLHLGTRLKHITADAGEVSTSMAMMNMPMSEGSMESDMHDGMGNSMDEEPMMPSMSALASELRDDFNQADRSVSDTLIDVSFNSTTQATGNLAFTLGLGLKNRAPSYQERYLWTPMESTGGLADGNTYIGDINLKAETAYQIDLGLNYQGEQWRVSPHLFFQRIDDYIQGTPLGMQEMSAKMMAMMMAGNETPLKFSNVDAQLLGMDVSWLYRLTEDIELSGVVNYVEGERRDINDHLYRIAPLNMNLTLSILSSDWQLNTTLVAAAEQDKVSVTNREQQTAGYGIINLDLNYYANNQVTLRAGVDNLLDKEYSSHLGGYNRVKGSEVPLMERVPSSGLSAWAEVSYSF